MTILQSICGTLNNIKNPFTSWTVVTGTDRLFSRSTASKYLRLLAKAGYLEELDSRPGLEKLYKVSTYRLIPKDLTLKELQKEVEELGKLQNGSKPVKPVKYIPSLETKQRLDTLARKYNQLVDQLSGFAIPVEDLSISTIVTRKTWVTSAKCILNDLEKRLNAVYESYTLDVEQQLQEIINRSQR